MCVCFVRVSVSGNGGRNWKNQKEKMIEEKEQRDFLFLNAKIKQIQI